MLKNDELISKVVWQLSYITSALAPDISSDDRFDNLYTAGYYLKKNYNNSCAYFNKYIIPNANHKIIMNR